MRKALLITVGAVALGAVVVATAVSVSATPQSAVVVHDGACGLFDGDGNIVIVPDGFFAVTNSSGRMAKCVARGLANTDGTTKHYDFANTGSLCNANGVLTDDWHQTVSASGNGTIICKAKN